MIQRIQSIFLLLGAGACFGLLGLPLAETDEALAQGYFTDADFDILDNWSMLVLFLGAGLLLFVAIFLYKNRPTQLKLALVSILLIVGGAVAGGILLSQSAAADQAQLSFGIALPFLAIVFSLLARRGIYQDEKLVRSADRLR
jgi:peptidoglycan/LPS O-acetylase OafA/YrhL